VSAVVSDPTVTAAVGGVPGGSALLGLVGLALGYGVKSRAKASEDRAWDEAAQRERMAALERQQAELIARLTKGASQ